MWIFRKKYAIFESLWLQQLRINFDKQYTILKVLRSTSEPTFAFFEIQIWKKINWIFRK